ncbi:helix-turn-helix transcriptional regulator [Streptomyces sp. NPDC005813]|uniref:helix-turn-helix transcriptional regulator n=1 Tax=Streptomyces sp. NPDC005813 TaxID=3155592 RepID=UPI0033C5CFC7
MSEDRNSRDLLAAFLRNRRARIDPADVGFPKSARRRTPGLRREEVAVLAGVSPAWYTVLEQGREVSPSAEVLDSVAQALRLTDDERAYLHGLANGSLPTVESELRHAQTEAELQAVIDSTNPRPAYMFNRVGDILGWNLAAAEWYDDFGRLPENRRNFLWWMFTSPEAPERIVDWATEAQDLVGQFRVGAAALPGHGRIPDLIAEVERISPQFARLWREHYVSGPARRIRSLRHPRHGVVRMKLITLYDEAHASIGLTLHMPLDPLPPALSEKSR